MTLVEIYDLIDRNMKEMHKYDECYLNMVDNGLAYFFNCHGYSTVKCKECPYYHNA